MPVPPDLPTTKATLRRVATGFVDARAAIDIDIAVFLHGGGEERMRYYLHYSLPADTGDNYADVST